MYDIYNEVEERTSFDIDSGEFSSKYEIGYFDESDEIETILDEFKIEELAVEEAS